MKFFKLAISALCGAISAGIIVKKVWIDKYKLQNEKLSFSEKERKIWYTWFLIEQKGFSCLDFFVKYNYKTIAVYGMNGLGRCLVDYLIVDSKDIFVKYAVEKDKPSAVHEKLKVYRMGDDKLPKADCIVICDLNHVHEKHQELKESGFKGKVVSFSDILMYIINKNNICSRDGLISDWYSNDLLTGE